MHLKDIHCKQGNLVCLQQCLCEFFLPICPQQGQKESSMSRWLFLCRKHNFPLQPTTKGSDTTSEDNVVLLEFLLKAEKEIQRLIDRGV